MIKQMECEQRKQEDTEPESVEGVSEEEISLGELIRRCRAGDEEARMTLREFMQENPLAALVISRPKFRQSGFAPSLVLTYSNVK